MLPKQNQANRCQNVNMLHYLDVPFPGYPVINVVIDVAAFLCALAYYRWSAEAR
jgi:hypothetical protein